MESCPRMIYLPDTMTTWPWPRRINPHFEAVKLEADAWLRDFKVTSPESQDAFEKYDFSRLAALGYPNAPRERLRIGCDFINVFVIVDEYAHNADPVVAKERVDIIIDALHNPLKARPEGECIIGEIVRQFWARAIQSTSLTSQRRFLNSSIECLRSIVVKALECNQGHCRSIDDYFKLRQKTVGFRPGLILCEFGMDLPDVLNHTAIVELEEYIVEMLIIDNDMLSYNREHATGVENHNLITVVMLELGLDVGGAMAWASRYHAQLQTKFMDGFAKVPLWGSSADALIKEYLDAIATLIRGNYCWSFESSRYFGTKGAEIQQTRLVPMLPKFDRKVASAEVNVVDFHDVHNGTRHDSRN